MKTYYSIISFLNNSVSDEKIAFGLLVLSDSKNFIEFSNSKLKFIKRMNHDAYNLLHNLIPKFNDTFLSNFGLGNNLSLDSLYKLNAYEQGVLNFSSPKILNESVDDVVFNSYFQKWIENNTNNFVEEKPEKIISNFKTTLKENIGIFKNKIDVNYTVETKDIPDLIFDFKLDAIAANGSLITAKAIDLVNLKRASVETTIAKYELLLDCLIPFSERRLNLHSNHENLLIINKPNDKNENIEIYQKLKKQTNFDFKVMEADDIKQFQNIISKDGVGKFSERLVSLD